MLADDLMAAVFPDAAACLENIPGDREIPDHPLVKQTVRDCLQEAMDFDGLRAVLAKIHSGELRLVARDTPEPSLFAHEILNAKPYAFLDDAPLEERRTQAVQSRRAGERPLAGDLGALDPEAIQRVRDEERPDPRDPDETHDALLSIGFLTPAETDEAIEPHLEQLIATRRAARAWFDGHTRSSGPDAAVWVAAERLPEIRTVHAGVVVEPTLDVPASRTARGWTYSDALAELVRNRMTILGPVTSQVLADSFCVPVADIDAALLTLETEGVVLRGRFSPGPGDLEWSDRALLARIHRYTLNRLRAEIEPVSVADFMRFLFRWQHVEPAARLAGLDGLREIVAMLDGYELASGAWERSVLAARLDAYDPSLLDMLCLTGEVGWARLSAPPVAVGTRPEPPRLSGATPLALFLRENGPVWLTLRATGTGAAEEAEPKVAPTPLRVLEALRTRGASFFPDLAKACSLSATELRDALGTLVATGLVSSDGFSGLRALIWASRESARGRQGRTNFAGRWTVLDNRTRQCPLVTREGD